MNVQLKAVGQFTYLQYCHTVKKINFKTWFEPRLIYPPAQKRFWIILYLQVNRLRSLIFLILYYRELNKEIHTQNAV